MAKVASAVLKRQASDYDAQRSRLFIRLRLAPTKQLVLGHWLLFRVIVAVAAEEPSL